VKLLIAEKSSVCKRIADVVGATWNPAGYYESPDLLLVAAQGHLVGTCWPDEYDPATYKAWALETLPILPEDIPLKILAATKSIFLTIYALAHRGDITGIISATDVDREGELIFDLIYRALDIDMPVSRFWTSSLEPGAIRNGLDNLLPIERFSALLAAARARQCADWYIGMNLTRLYSVLYGRTLHVGRVQSWIVAQVARRCANNESFTAALSYKLDAAFSGFTTTMDADNRDSAGALAIELADQAASVTSVDKVAKSTAPPHLYNLTDLSIDAATQFGFEPELTQSLAEDLYMQGLITYPGTSARYISHDMIDSTRELITDITSEYEGLAGVYTLDPTRLNLIVDDKAVDKASHPALLPTPTLSPGVFRKLKVNQRRIAGLIITRLLQATSAAAEYDAYTAKIAIGEHLFTSQASIVRSAGFRAIVSPNKAFEKHCDTTDTSKTANEAISSLQIGQKLSAPVLSVSERKTTPPKLFTAATLLKFMQNPSDIDDPEYKADLKRAEGIGTERTRSTIITSTIENGYLEQVRKSYRITPLGHMLATVLDPALTDTHLTAALEHDLNAIANSKDYYRGAQAFLDRIKNQIRALVASAPVDVMPEYVLNRAGVKVGRCPVCGSWVYEKAQVLKCEKHIWDPQTRTASGCPFQVFAALAGRRLSTLDAVELFARGCTRRLDGFKKKDGSEFSARVTLDLEKLCLTFAKRGEMTPAR